uniref:Tetraspanin n=1 Tax=Macrostomum lignano TaxID=282301 RepID=A0A1I8IY64_9PLAT
MSGRVTNSCMKMFLIVVNLLFLLTGIAILGVGIYLCTSADLGKYSELLAGVSLMRSLRYLLIGCGCFTILIAMCGCVGVCKENRCLLGVYVILLFLVLFINLAAAIMAVVYKGDFKGMVGEQFQDRLKRHYGNLTIKESKMFTEAIDKLQRNDKCCGWAGLDKQQNFFLSTPWYQQQSSNPAQFPDSCCGSGVLDSPAKKEKCVRPKNEQEAREGGFIHEHAGWRVGVRQQVAGEQPLGENGGLAVGFGAAPGRALSGGLGRDSGWPGGVGAIDIAYTEFREGAPQYCSSLPVHGLLQSLGSPEPCDPKKLPQKHWSLFCTPKYRNF